MTRRFASEDLGLDVFVLESVIEAIEDHCIGARGLETGGRLVGHYPSGDTVTVSHVMGPAADSVLGEETFDTGVEGVEEWLREHEANGSSYVGEWHSHPHEPPTPSAKDQGVMDEIANDEDYGNPNPLLFVMGGDEDGGFDLSVSVAFRDDRPFTMFEEVAHP